MERRLLSASDDSHPVPFNNVMVGTFALVGLEGAHTVQRALAAAPLDWPSAMVLVLMGIGTKDPGAQG